VSLLRIEVVRRAADLGLHAEAWDALVAAQPWPSPLALSSWFAAFAEHKLEAGAAWLVLLAYDGLVLRGVLPLVQAAAGALRRRRWRVPGEYFTHDGDLLLDEGLEPVTLTELLEGLAAEEPGALGVDVGGIHPASRTRVALAGLHAAGGVPLETEAEGAYIPVRGSFDGWYAGISENLRVNLRKARNRLDREQPGALAFRFHARADASPALLDDFARLEDLGWKGEEGGALARSPAKLSLYRTLVARWAAAGVLEWHLATLAGRPVAMHMAVRLGRVLTLMRICYDETIAKHMPGNLLIRAMVEREHASRASDAVDFVQTQPWQHNWRMTRTAYARARIPEPGLLPALGGLPRRTSALLRRIPGLRSLVHRLRGG
jgi:CelD/BcsL family acetyltransferase involved in cellulose biosynthesis